MCAINVDWVEGGVCVWELRHLGDAKLGECLCEVFECVMLRIAVAGHAGRYVVVVGLG